jgi:modification methylase
VTEPKPERVAFKQILNAGYLQVGDNLLLDKPECEAVILEDGHLKVGDLTGSIHRLGARLKNAPTCNGWMHWFYRDADGQIQPIDALREQYRAQAGN